MSTSFVEHSEGARCQQLRTLLLTVTELTSFWWDSAYEACFANISPPRLKRLGLVLGPEDLSMKALKALPNLEELCIYNPCGQYTQEELEPVISVLVDRGLHRLHTIQIDNFM